MEFLLLVATKSIKYAILFYIYEEFIRPNFYENN